MKKGSRKGVGMASHELLHEVCKKPGSKNVAQAVGLSLSLIHQWSRARGDRSEAMNPLDRVEALIQFTGDVRLAQWVCERADGYFVKNPAVMSAPRTGKAEPSLLLATAKLVGSIAEFEVKLSATELHGCISAADGRELRSAWEKLKSVGESFVQACERGMFRCA